MNNQQTAQNTDKSRLIQKLAVPILALILLLTVVAWLAGFFDNKIAPQLSATADSIAADYVKSARSYTVTSKKSKVFEGVAASITAKQATIISSRLLARVDAIKVRAGDTVKQGDVLISLEQNNLS